MRFLGTVILPISPSAPESGVSGQLYFDSTKKAGYIFGQSGFSRVNDEKVSFSYNIPSGSYTATVPFLYGTFDSIPSVGCSLRTTNTGDPFIGAMLQSVTASGFTVSMTEALPSSNYYIDAIVLIP